jgi:hypothetical protein
MIFCRSARGGQHGANRLGARCPPVGERHADSELDSPPPIRLPYGCTNKRNLLHRGFNLLTCGRGSVVEHHLAKVRVAGSNPVVRSEVHNLAVEWPRGEATACKAVYTGSNPVSTSIYGT